MRLIYSIKLPDYPTHVQLSKSQRATYYDFDATKGIRDDKYPKKYQKDITKYDFQEIVVGKKKVYRLYDLKLNAAIIKNIDKEGTPKIKPINGQDGFNTSSNAFMINKTLDQIKEWFLSIWNEEQFELYKESFVRLDCKYPLVFRFIYNCPKGKLQDIDNQRILYEKAIIDSLKFFKCERKTSKDKIEKVYNPIGILQDDHVELLSRVTSEWEESEERFIQLMFYEK